MSSDPKNYLGFTFDEFTELDCKTAKKESKGKPSPVACPTYLSI